MKIFILNKFEILNNLKLNKKLFFFKFFTELICFFALLNIILFCEDKKFIYIENLKLNITSVNYSFSYIFQIAKIEYNFVFYDSNNEVIEPSDLTLYYNLHIFCHSIEINNNMTIKSIAYIHKNKYYNCIEYFNIQEKMNFGIIIYKIDKYYEYFTINVFSDNFINYNNFFLKNDEEFSPLMVLKNHFQLQKFINGEISTKFLNASFLLMKSYIIIPKFSVKSNFAAKKEKWYYNNIYNNYFCFCKSSEINKCKYKNINKKCKYNIYLNIIDNGKNLYNKTDYLLADFSSPDTAPCEAYLLYEKMIELNINAHFITQREDIYKKYYNLLYWHDIPILFSSTIINGEFLEKYLKIFFKLKATISGAKLFPINNLFYNIDYITYICLGHGISYLKDFLYNDYYSSKVYNKIILPNSKIIIDNAMKYGWKYNDIIKFGLPRWDIFFLNDSSYIKNENIQNNSIFIMFTWRELKKDKKISKYYLNFY